LGAEKRGRHAASTTPGILLVDDEPAIRNIASLICLPPAWARFTWLRLLAYCVWYGMQPQQFLKGAKTAASLRHASPRSDRRASGFKHSELLYILPFVPLSP
jgi:hypothetical protein